MVNLNAVFSTRNLFDGSNGSIYIRNLPQNLKKTFKKTVQHMFKFVAAWSLKRTVKIQKKSFLTCPWLRPACKNWEQEKVIEKISIKIRKIDFSIQCSDIPPPVFLNFMNQLVSTNTNFTWWELKELFCFCVISSDPHASLQD